MASQPLHDRPWRAVVASTEAPIPVDQEPYRVKAKGTDSSRRKPRRNSLRRAKNSAEQLRKRARGGSDVKLAADGQHADREGRQFTVSSIGNNGIIYLRPVVRPGNQRAQLPLSPFAFPSPSTSSTEGTVTTSKSLQPPKVAHRESFYSGTRTSQNPSALAAIPKTSHGRSQHSNWTPQRRPSRAKSFSFSTTDDHQALQPSDPGSFRVVIDRQPSSKRPKTADNSGPVLKVSIPHYRLGSPRFSAKGTAILRSSAYTGLSGTEDMRSSVLSSTEKDKALAAPAGVVRKSVLARRHSEAFQRPGHATRTAAGSPSKYHSLRSASSPKPLPKAAVAPAIYDPLTVNPDDPSVVRFSNTGEIAAAIPARLIAHITSPNFVDYELLSDFFLTFRSFLSSSELVDYLIARLQWAVNRADDFGRIVRVRTFVALRHWILNYFVDDFLPDFELRMRFCALVNDLYNSLRVRDGESGGDSKIVGELKKCWRRTCVLYWSESEMSAGDSAKDDILPGGQAGLGDSDGITGELALPVPPATAKVAQNIRDERPLPVIRNNIELSEIGSQVQHLTLKNGLHSSQNLPKNHKSRASEQSMQAMSCSIPVLASNRADSGSDRRVFPHPVGTAQRTNVQPSTTTKPCRSMHSHKRSGSFSDALRDHRAPLSLPKAPSSDAPLSVHPFSGSLIRGAIFEPSPPFLDAAVSEDGDRKRSPIDVRITDRAALAAEIWKSGTAQNQGMKKIIGSVRRALSGRQTSTPVYSGGASEEPLAASRSSDFSSRPSAAYSSGASNKKRRSRPQNRVDILAAEVAEAYKKAVLAEVNKEGGGPGVADVPHNKGLEGNKELGGESKNEQRSQLERLTGNVTMGSRSIVIVDDTGFPGEHLMSGALAAQEAAKASSKGVPFPFQQDSREINAVRNWQKGQIRAAEGLAQPLSHDNPSVGRVPQRMGSEKMSDGRSATQSAYVGRPPVLRHSRSVRSGQAASTSLRKFASYQSGIGRPAPTLSAEGTSFSYIYSTTSTSETSEASEVDSHPLRRLRRRPGGDLRAFQNVHDLEQLQRPRSTGSLSNRTHSVTNSVALTSVDATAKTFETKPTTNLTDEASRDANGEPSTVPRKPYSLVQTHSSQPNLRPSFEAEVAKLAALPDDEDDGGIESALLKLEGRYEKKSPEQLSQAQFEAAKQPTNISTAHANSGQMDTGAHGYPTLENNKLEKTVPRGVVPRSTPAEAEKRIGASPNHPAITTVRSVAASDDSYSSVPLLQRGLSDAFMPRRVQPRPGIGKGPVHRKRPSSPPTSITTKTAVSPDSKSLRPSTRNGAEAGSVRKMSVDRGLPRASVGGGSFLLDENQSLTDASSELSTELLDTSENGSHEVLSFFDDEDAADSQPENDILAHPLRHPPTPPLSEKSVIKSPATDAAPFQQKLPTPGATPVASAPIHSLPHLGAPIGQIAIEVPGTKGNSTSQAKHLPFVLAYDPDVLAEQLTVIEKDALDEIDWKELIELRWKQSSTATTNWVDYLRNEEPRGVDIVIARFNLMVKWVVSECVLTDNVEERARALVKYIQVAAHARRLRNYATMYQITVALLSSDCSRLKQTWELVPPAEKQVMTELEAVIQPLRNFQNLRIEMETAPVENGCIPFIGIYTHDLIYNAQKPAYIKPSAAGGEPLVNFERHRTAATIVKNLLRLLEASSKYRFKPQPEIISRCLWMAALPDKDITELSRTLAARE